MIQLGEQQFRRYARRGKRRLIRKSCKGHFYKSAAVRHWEGIRIYRKVGVDASQTWFGALFNCRFDRFVSDYKTIQPSCKYGILFLLRPQTVQAFFKLLLPRSPGWPGHEAEQRGGAEVGLPGHHPHRAGGARHQDGGEGWRHQRGL